MSAPATNPLFFADRSTAPPVVFERSEQLIELAEHACREHVGGSARLVEGEPGDAVGVALELPGSGAGIVHVTLTHRNQAAEAAEAVGLVRAVAPACTRKSHTRGRWSEKRTSGTRKPVTSMPSLTRMKSSSMRGTRAGKEGRPAVLALRSPAARMKR